MNFPPLHEQFNNFYKQNPTESMQTLLENFAIFGGLGETIDVSKPLNYSIEKHILFDYKKLHTEITSITKGHAMYHAVLTGVAQGDSQTHTAFRRSSVSNEAGKTALSFLSSTGLVKTVWSKAKKTQRDISDKVEFATPFFRFWFAFISPLFKGIQKRDFKEFYQRFENQFTEFVAYTFAQLSQELVKQDFKDDAINDMGSFWDKNTTIDIMGTTASGKVVAGVCKYTQKKLNKNELAKLQQQCKEANINADIFVIVSKEGFSKELKSLKSDTVKLYTLKNFKNLLA